MNYLRKNSIQKSKPEEQLKDCRVRVYIAAKHSPPPIKLRLLTPQEDLSPINGIPGEQLKGRRVRVYIPAKHSPQSGEYGGRTWKIQFDTQRRWDNPLMGWTSTLAIMIYYQHNYIYIYI